VIDVLNYLAAGIVTGGLYALVALGLTLIFGVMRFINVAHGDFLAIGAYAAVAWGLIAGGLPAGSVVVALVVVLLAGVVAQRVVLGRIEQDGRFDERRAMVLTLGLSLLISNLLLASFGAQPRAAPPISEASVHLGDLSLQGQRLVILGGSVVLSVLLLVFLTRTRLGLAIRATSQNPEAAQASGIDIRLIQVIVFAVGSALAGAAGALVAPITYAYAAMGLPITIKAFIVVILGGLGSIPGAIFAGYLLGVVESLSVLWLPPGFNAALGLVMMIVVLVFRPEGLFTRKSRVG
jgi:branched-chain amino acid transport system permease protein